MFQSVQTVTIKHLVTIIVRFRLKPTRLIEIMILVLKVTVTLKHAKSASNPETVTGRHIIAIIHSLELSLEITLNVTFKMNIHT